MKRGNQFYLDFQIEDEIGNLLEISSVSKVQFTINNLIKEYDGIKEDVTYENGIFKVWLTEKETFAFPKKVKMEARVLFKNDIILGTEIEIGNWKDSIKEVLLDA